MGGYSHLLHRVSTMFFWVGTEARFSFTYLTIMPQKIVRLVLELSVDVDDKPRVEKLRALCDLAGTNHEFTVEGSVLDGLLVAPVTAMVYSITEFPTYSAFAVDNGSQINITLYSRKRFGR